jgi:FkbM family methyltransferase
VREKKLYFFNNGIRNADYGGAWLVALASHADSIFDIGCNMSHSALPCLLQGNVKKMICVDPNPRAIGICSENIFLNHVSASVRFVRAFVSEPHGDNIDFYTVGGGTAGSMHRSHARTASNLGSVLRVPTTTIDFVVQVSDIVPNLAKFVWKVLR